MPTIKKRGYAAQRQPEQEIVTIAHKVSGVMTQYRKQLITAGAVAAAIIILLAGYMFLQAQQERKAEPLVAAAYESYSPAGGAPDFNKALEGFRDVVKKYGGTRSAAIAQYYVGNCLMSLGRPDEAIKEYQNFVSRYTGEKFLLGLVYQRMGYAYQGLGKNEDAVKSFQQAESLNGPGVATVELARIYEAAGNKAEADRENKVIADKLLGTSWAMEAMGKVQKLSPLPQPAAKETK